ncbi:hypothetical protein QW71_26295 [Paenibacillus sp. IHB B 3415]|uniref:hypothetical protein n=1 Tax=Paenibacillus sp. IHB B 3415 TaxID=867080 RepID=UPI000574752B|nr:hypothetical protein QW71_26295 [Paenibacillus sp. IHB B 3415]
MSQLTSPQNEGLFQRAIVESGIFTKLNPGTLLPPHRSDLQEADLELCGDQTAPIEEARQRASVSGIEYAIRIAAVILSWK